MAKIISLQEAQKVTDLLHEKNKRIVLVGGCFDILHIGHVKFLKKAKSYGDCLLLILEPDEKVKKLKGDNRPVFHQQDRAEMLSSIKFLDYIIILPLFSDDSGYKKLIHDLKPDVIAVTENDPVISKKAHYAAQIGGEIKTVRFIHTLSSSKLIQLLGLD